MLVLRDSSPALGPSGCPPATVTELTGGRLLAPSLCLRLAEQAIEAWLLADVYGASQFFGVAPRRFPREPEKDRRHAALRGERPLDLGGIGVIGPLV